MSIESTADNPPGGWLPRTTLVAAVLLAVTLLPSAGAATVVTYADLDDLVTHSDTIIRGEVAEQRTLYDSDQERIVTRTSFEVAERYLDESGESAERVTIEQWGGTWEGKTRVVPGDATFEPGEEVIVFLREGPEGGLYLTSLAQSKFTVERSGAGPLVTRNLAELVFVEEAAEAAGDDRSTYRLDGESRRLEVFEAELQSLIYARRGGSP